MKKTSRHSLRTVRLSSFGAGLALIAANLSQAANATAPVPPVAPAAAKPPIAATARPIVIDRATLCKIGDQTCMLDQPYVKALSGTQRQQLQVLIGMNVQTDIKDACMVC